MMCDFNPVLNIVEHDFEEKEKLPIVIFLLMLWAYVFPQIKYKK